MKGSYILAIETSCDDTCIAVSRNDEVLSNVCISSQAAHKTYGGIVPEIAARSHQTNLSKCYEQAIKKAKIQPNQLTHVAYTALPGLPGSLHMGKFFAKSIATLLHIPLIPINHMYGHIYSFAIDNITLIKYPFLALIISGGHTAIYFVKSINNVEILNETADDAAGEVLDKIGRALNFAYPGGISIDNVFNPKKTNTKLIHHFKPEEKFSFSGIKTHILNLINQNKLKKLKIDDIAIASSLLKWVVDEILIKLNYYLQKYPQVRFVTIGGGVSANKLLRKEIKKIARLVLLPQLKYTNDNAAMISLYAFLTIK